MAIRGTTIGRKDVRIQIQSRTSTKDAVTNEPLYTYTTFAHVWAEELGMPSGEKYEASQQVATNASRFRIRHSHTVASSLNETCRIIRGSDTFEISKIEPIGRKSEILITAERRDNG